MSVSAPVKMTPQQMADFMCELAQLCHMQDGAPANADLHLDANQVRKIGAVADFLNLIAPHREKLLDIVRGRR